MANDSKNSELDNNPSPLIGKFTALCPVEKEDAGLMISLRSNPALTKYLPPINTTIEKQIEWIESLSGNNSDYMFSIRDIKTNNTVGFIGIYNISADSAEWGRWIVSSPTIHSYESVALLHYFAFEKLGLNRVYCRTVVENIQVVNFHKKYGSVENIKFTGSISVNGIVYKMIEQGVERIQWPEIYGKYKSLYKI